MNFHGIQNEIADWHRKTFPTASLKDIGLKLAEESGEFCRAIVEQEHPSLHRASTNELGQEIGDVLIVCLALAAKAGLNGPELLTDRWEQVKTR